MVPLAFLDDFTVPSPLPPYNVGSVRSKCPPWSNIDPTLYGGRGECKFGEKSRFYHRTGGDNENKANFQGVPYTFDQDCSSKRTARLTVAVVVGKWTFPSAGNEYLCKHACDTMY